MKTKDPRNPGTSAYRAPWWWMIGFGWLLVLLLAVFLPKVKRDHPGSGLSHNRYDSASPAAQTGHSFNGLPHHREIGAAPRIPAEQIVAEKLSQFARNRREIVQAMARHFNVKVPAEVERFFDAVEAGRWDEARALFDSLKKLRHSGQAGHNLAVLWPAILDTYGAADLAHLWPAQELLDYGDAVLGSLGPGMVYVGGTDAGRWIPELLNDTSSGERHIVITQNALADNSYLDYLNFLYGDRMSTLTAEDTQRAFQEYIADAQKRLEHDQQFPNEPSQIRPGEQVTNSNGRLQVSGQVAVMAINGILLKALLQKNPDIPFALQESFPLKSFYADASTLGPVTELRAGDGPDALTPGRATQAVDYWSATVQQLLADPAAPADSGPRSAYSKLMLAQANLFLDHNYPEQAEQTYRLANELSPDNSETVLKYVNLLTAQKRYEEARQVVATGLRLAPGNRDFQNLLAALQNK